MKPVTGYVEIGLIAPVTVNENVPAAAGDDTTLVKVKVFAEVREHVEPVMPVTPVQVGETIIGVPEY